MKIFLTINSDPGSIRCEFEDVAEEVELVLTTDSRQSVYHLGNGGSFEIKLNAALKEDM